MTLYHPDLCTRLFALFNFRSTNLLFFFFFNDTATTEIYTLSLHDALPICVIPLSRYIEDGMMTAAQAGLLVRAVRERSEEHTSELQSHSDLVCRLLLEKKKKRARHHQANTP